MRMVMALARSRASFLTSCNSLRNCWVSSTFAMIFSAISLLRLKKCSNSSRTWLTRSVRISVLPSLFFVCDSNTGSFSRIATAPTMLSRTSSPSNLSLAYSLTALSKPFAKRAQVRAAVAGVLAVDEGIKRLAVTAVAVRETKLQRLARRNAAADKSVRCRPPANPPCTRSSRPLRD